MKKIGAVINRESGTMSPAQRTDYLEKIRRNLEARVEPEYLAIVPGDQVRRELRRITGLGIDTLVVGGGDGTVSAAAGFVRDSDITLAVLSLGTRNHFALDLEVPPDPADAISLLDRMQVRQIDLGEVNGHVFINNATVGLYPTIVEKREETMQKRGWRKWWSHMAAALHVLWWLPKIRLIVESKSFRADYLSPFLFVGNNEYRGVLTAETMRPVLDSGKLWFCMARASGIWSLLHLAWQLIVRGIEDIDYIETHLVDEVTVRSRRKKLKIAIDGEKYSLDTPLHFRILRKSLRVVTP